MIILTAALLFAKHVFGLQPYLIQSKKRADIMVLIIMIIIIEILLVPVQYVQAKIYPYLLYWYMMMIFANIIHNHSMLMSSINKIDH